MKNESLTLFIPLYGKAQMSREGLFLDPDAERIVAAVDYDFSAIDQSRRLAIYLAMRAALYDGYARDFASAHPDGVILQLGVGLDSRVQRVQAENLWFDLDFPDVIALRRQYFQETHRYRLIASPALPVTWLEEIPSASHALVLAEGLSMYLSQADMVALGEALRAHFGAVTFIFDAYTPLAAKFSRFRNPVNAMNARIDFAVQDASAVAAMFSGASVTDTDIITPEGMAPLKVLDRMRFRWMGQFSGRFYRIYQVAWE